MNENTFGGIDEILKYLGYEKDDSYNSNNNSNEYESNSQNCNRTINDDGTIDSFCERFGIKYKCTIDPSGGARGNCCRNFNSDILGGFQDINPNLYIVLAEVIGDLLAGELPFNVANSVSNWFNLVGQIIETYAAQLVYFQSGPGRYYNPQDRNVTNPFCSSSRVTEDESDSNSTSDSTSNTSNTDDNSKTNSCDSIEDNSSDDNIKETVKRISEEIENVKNQFDTLNNKVEMLKINIESLKK